MSTESSASANQRHINQVLRGVRFELMPFDSFEQDIAKLPDGATVAVTMSSQLGIEKTIRQSEKAAMKGYDVVPHLTARFIDDRDELDNIATRLLNAGITNILALGGDREMAKGEFNSSYEMLVALDELGHEFESIGIGGYPEGHQFLTEDTLTKAIKKKEPYSTYIVTKLCLYPKTIIRWMDSIRSKGVELPVEIGIPGVMKYQRLLKMSQKVGVINSLKFLQKTMGIFGFMKEFAKSKGEYTPDKLINELAPYIDDTYYNVRGVNIYTFNQISDTESWRHNRLNL